MAITVVDHKRSSLFLLIFSLVIYVRDAGVAGSNPATPTRIRWFFVLIAGDSRVNHRFNPRNVPAFLTDSRRCSLQKVRVMVAVGFLQDLR